MPLAVSLPVWLTVSETIKLKFPLNCLNKRAMYPVLSLAVFWLLPLALTLEEDSPLDCRPRRSVPYRSECFYLSCFVMSCWLIWFKFCMTYWETGFNHWWLLSSLVIFCLQVKTLRGFMRRECSTIPPCFWEKIWTCLCLVPGRQCTHLNWKTSRRNVLQ